MVEAINLRFKKIIKLFKRGNVSVFGLRGRGKDLLFSNVIVRRRNSYISNINYGGKYIPLDLTKLDVKNNYSNFISNSINYYNYDNHYPKNVDIYISDLGVYLPSQYCNKLNNAYDYLPTFMALSRQLGRCNVHFNSQNLNRVWDKVREQSDIYIQCDRVIYIPFSKLKIFRYDFVIQKITLYDKYESAVARVKPCRVSPRLFDKNVSKVQIKMYLDNFYNQHGEVKSKFLFYRNKSTYDTFYFDKLLKHEIILDGEKTYI